MADYTITIAGVDEEKLAEAIDIAVGAVRDALDKAGLGSAEVTAEELEDEEEFFSPTA